MYLYIYNYIHTFLYFYLYIYIHFYIYIFIFIYIYIYMFMCLVFLGFFVYKIYQGSEFCHPNRYRNSHVETSMLQRKKELIMNALFEHEHSSA